MNCVFFINPELDIPIYRQLVDAIRAAVNKGTLAPREQLPTVQELSEELGVARGTIKRAYDELERLGLVEKVQGRGTFVRYRPSQSGSSREQAMAAIDTLLEQLEDMGFTAAEINIFLNLKLRERSEQESRVKVALVECNSENLSCMADQLRTISGIDLYSHLLESIEQYPYKLDDSLDLIVTTMEHASYLEQVIPAGKRLAKVALRLKPQCMAEIIKIKRGKRVGILCYSQRFGQLLYRNCLEYSDNVQLQKPEMFSGGLDMRAYLQDLDVVLLPQNYEKYCSGKEAQLLNAFTGAKIECSYEMDAGSFLYLQEKTRRILEERTI
ncbi:MAG: GntR family transcriptional regulator [Oscillospiraceae bacterium]|nr:GntR family transcriptional regulator [Oscillospiraceae bacterium]